MVAASRAAAGMGYVGYPAQIFYEKINFNRGPQSHIERMWILVKWFSNLDAYLPIYYQANKNIKEYEEIFPMMEEIQNDLSVEWELYDPAFEGLGTCNPDEKAFIRNMAKIIKKLDWVTAQSRVIDKQKLADEEMVF
jgi:hypothetical protein